MDPCIVDIHAHYPMMGYRQISDILEWQFGWKLSDPIVWCSMNRIGVHGYTRKRKLPASYTGMEHTRYANILSPNFQSDKPLQKTVTDVTYIKHRGKWKNTRFLEWWDPRPATSAMRRADSSPKRSGAAPTPWFYLAASLDLFNNEIVKWERSDTFDNFLILRPAERLLKKTESAAHPILLHSDQGVQYASTGYCNPLS